MHHEALTEEGRKVFPYLKDFKDFYLAGGTALALQLGHRVSVDFDFFSEEQISSRLLPKITRLFSTRKISPSLNNPDELTVFLNEVKITFLRYPFPPLFPLQRSQGIRLLSITDIAVTKAYTIGRRGEWKDYVDLYFCLYEKHCTLPEILSLAETKYGSEFNDRLFLEQLLYLDDVSETSINFLKKVVSTEELVRFFEEKVKEVQI
jgi:hypothetical protein